MAVNFFEIFELLPEAALVLDAQARIAHVNVRAEALLGIGRAKLTAKPLSETVDAPALLVEVRRCAHIRESITLPQVALRSLLAPLPTYAERSARIIPLGEEDTLILFGEPLTAAREAKDDVREEVGRTAGLMAAMLAHEINNPLSGIRGAAQLLGEEVAEEHKPLAALICKEVDRIHSVLDRVEMFADRSDLPRAPMNIHEALRHAKQVAEYGFGRHVQFVERYDPSLPELLSHRDSVVHILLNLIKNACEALAEVESPRITLKTSAIHKAGNFSIAVDIQDNGAGIAPELREHIFTPLISRRSQGRGLGLSICSKIAGDIGAQLTLVESTSQGTCFRLVLGVS